MDFHIPREPATGAPSRLGAFAHPAFAIVWTASTCALLGIAMYDTASGWLMTTLDVDPFEVSLVHAAAMLPMFLFTLPAGAIADIVDPRRMIIAVSYAIAALMAVFAAVVSLDFASPLLLLVTTFVLSAAWALNTPAWLSILPLLVPKPEIPGAMAAHAGETDRVASRGEAQQRAPDRPQACRQQPPAVGDAGADDGDLSVHCC